MTLSVYIDNNGTPGKLLGSAKIPKLAAVGINEDIKNWGFNNTNNNFRDLHRYDTFYPINEQEVGRLDIADIEQEVGWIAL